MISYLNNPNQFLPLLLQKDYLQSYLQNLLDLFYIFLAQVYFRDFPLRGGLVIYELGGIQLRHRPANLFLSLHPIRGSQKDLPSLNDL